MILRASLLALAIATTPFAAAAPAAQPDAKSVTKPAAKAAKKKTSKPVAKPAAKSKKKSNKKTAAKPAVKPAAISADKPAILAAAPEAVAAQPSAPDLPQAAQAAALPSSPQAAPAIAIPWWPGQPTAPQAALPVPKTPEEWMTRMTDFTRNTSAFKDPRMFVAWSHAVTEPGFYLTAAKGAMEPGGWLNMMNSMAHPDAVKNYMAFTDPNVYSRWLQAGVDPAFYTALLTQLTDPGKMMRWAMAPMDPRMWDIALAAVNPNTFIRWPMAGMDPRTWNFMGNVMNPALYTSMANAAANPNATAQSGNPWLDWRPNNLMGASSPWGADPMASFNMLDPALLSNLAIFLPGLPSLTGLMAAAPAPAATAPAAAAPAVAPVQTQAPAPVAEAAPAPASASEKATLDSGSLFKPGQSSVKGLSADGKKLLDQLAAKIKAAGPVEQIRVVGHADTAAKAEADRKVSEQQARAVKSYLVAKGVKPGTIITSGVGDAQPVAPCDAALAKDKLAACREPNNRVEVDVATKAK